MSRIDSILDIAKSYIGIAEGSAKHSEIISYYNKARYADAYKMTMNDPWCAAFVVACFARANCADLVPCVASCDQMISYFKKWNRFHKMSEGTIVRGDILFYDWNSDGGSDHVGIVSNNNMGLLQVIEGNKSDSVGYRNIRIGDPTIVGVGRPAYNGDSGIESTGTPVYAECFSLLSPRDQADVRRFPLLYQSSKGVFVSILQAMLVLYDKSDIKIDGDFGPLTDEAVRLWQEHMKLEVDGEVGKQTWASFFV